jgi:hypothetical protein
VDLERNIFDGWMGAEGDGEIGNIQQWRGFHWFDGSEFADKVWWNVWQRRLAVCSKMDFAEGLSV